MMADLMLEKFCTKSSILIAYSRWFLITATLMPVVMVTKNNNHHQLVLRTKAGSRSSAPPYCSITCFPFHSHVFFIFLQSVKHSYSSPFSSPFSISLPSITSFSRPLPHNTWPIQFFFLLTIVVINSLLSPTLPNTSTFSI